MADPKQLRRMAERLLAVAMNSQDEEIGRELTARASEYLDQAAVLEAASSASEAPKHVAQEADEQQPNGKKK